MSAFAGCPEAWKARLRMIVPPSRWEAVARSFSALRPTTLRVNTLKASRHVVREALHEAGLRVEPVAWYPDAFVLREGRLRELQQTQAYTEGWLYVQSPSSMLPPLVLDPQPGEAVLDLTAAPGSKTTQIACLMQEQGRLVANDNNRVRRYKLKANLLLQGAARVDVWALDGIRVGRRPGPEAALDVAHGVLHLALGLGPSGLTHPGDHAEDGGEVQEARVEVDPSASRARTTLLRLS